MTTPSPALAYYQACVGRWRAEVDFTLTDTATLRRSGMSPWDRLNLRLLAIWPRALGSVHLDTVVEVRSPQEVVHTTLVRWLGLTLRRSVETYALDPDGRRLVVGGDMTGSGSVDDTATHATYTFRWLGVEIHQQTTREGDRVTVDQRGPGFKGRQVLVRQGV